MCGVLGVFSGQDGATNETGCRRDSKLSVVHPLELCVSKSVSSNYMCLIFPWLIKYKAYGLIIFESVWTLCGTWEVNRQLIHKVAPCDSSQV